MVHNIYYENLSLILLFIILLHSFHAVDEIQFKSVDFQNNVVELFNFGNSQVGLDGWHFCTHDENQIRQYSSPSGLNGITLAAGASLFIYWDNNAPVEDTNNINLISIGGGGFAIPFDRGPFGMQLYINSSFGNGASIVELPLWIMHSGVKVVLITLVLMNVPTKPSLEEFGRIKACGFRRQLLQDGSN